MRLSRLGITAKRSSSRAPILVLVSFALVAFAVQSACAQSRWVLEALGSVATPAEPQRFVDGWRNGLGIGGSLRVRLGVVEVGVAADFMQFGFEGLENLGSLGGERRLARVAVPVRVALWEGGRRVFHGLYAQASGGWGHQSIAGTFGGVLATASTTQDGFAGTLDVRYARELYRRTRWSVGVRYTRFEFPEESPSHVSLLLGLQMPLDGSRPRGN
jgi:hypothetical protein